jgi:DNA-binding beta-propeller fold protein YncE
MLCAAALVAANAQYALDLRSAGATEQLRLGVVAYHKGRFAESILLFEKALAFEPAAPILRYWLGRSYYKAGYEATALRTWEALLSEPAVPAVLRASVERLRGSRAFDPAELGDRLFVETASFEGRVGRKLGFSRPAAILPAADGSLLVVAHGSNEILRIDANGVVRDRDRGGLAGYDRPFGIAALGNGTRFITEFNGDRITRQGGGLDALSFGAPGRGDGQLLGPQYASCDADGYLYVSDYGNARVVKFSPDGDFILAFGHGRPDFKGFTSPTGVVAHEGVIYVADSYARAIYRFDPSGNYLGEIASGLLHAPEGLSVAEDGKALLVADTDRIVSLDLERESPEVLYRSPAGDSKLVSAVMDRNGNLVVSDFDRSSVSVLADSRLLAAGYDVEIESVNALAFPKVRIDLRVRDAAGRPVVGLDQANFYLSERVVTVERIMDRGIAVDRRTESVVPLAKAEFLGSGDLGGRLRAVVMLESSPLMVDYAAPARAALEELLSKISAAVAAGKPASLGMVLANRSPVLAASLAEAWDPREFVRTLIGQRDGGGRFDLGLRLAATNLLPASARDAVIYLGSGVVDESSFQSSTLSELAALLANNGQRFYGILLGGQSPSPVLSYLAEQTGGALFAANRPRGLSDLIEQAFTAPSGRYALSFESKADPGFGANLLSVAAEAYLYKRSGRDEIGYYAPLR